MATPITPRFPRLWHGGDYNPDQWPEEIRLDDVRLMKLAHANMMSVGIFSWAALEPQPGEYTWGWLDETLDRLYQAGVYVALATPSAAHPRWLTAMHTEVMSVDQNGMRRLHSNRQRFCPTSPIYREHVARIDRALAERYKDHPAVVLWHVSNEYSTPCMCDLCAQAFREWLQARYGSLEALNHQWWSSFWSQRFADWSEVIPPFAHSGFAMNAHLLDWKRFQSHQVCDFFKHEVAILRDVTPQIPVTTNLMGVFPGLDYAKFADVMDVISWDSYPLVNGDQAVPCFAHALMRGLKDNQPWVLMEQTPSATNWQEHGTLKPPGVMALWSWEAIGHGSDAAMYFQWRRCRGGTEKFHGAVVEHAGSEQARVFKEVAALGEDMEALSEQIIGTRVAAARVGVLWDQENRWAIEGAAGPTKQKRYVETLQRYYKAVWRQNIPVDVVRMDGDWSQYDILIAPMLYMVKSGEYPLSAPPEEMCTRLNEAAKIEQWVANGGTFVTTFLSGIVNENDLVYEGGYPGPLRRLLGIWAEEIDAMEPGKSPNCLVPEEGAVAGLQSSYICDRLLDQINVEGAEVLARYGENWYAGRPCLTRNAWGQGLAYYIAADAEDAFLADFFRSLAADKGIAPLVEAAEEVEVLARVAADRTILFLLNHANAERAVDLGAWAGRDARTGEAVAGTLALPPYGVCILVCPPNPELLGAGREEGMLSTK